MAIGLPQSGQKLRRTGLPLLPITSWLRNSPLIATAFLGKTKRSTIFQARFNVRTKRGQLYRATIRARDVGRGYRFGQSNVVGIR